MCRCLRLSTGLVFILATTAAIASAASREKEQEPSKTKFLRLERDASENPVALETAIVHYKEK